MDAPTKSHASRAGPVAESDEELAVRALQDPDAFTHLYRTYALDVYRYCYRRLLSREMAEDATSQTFFNAYAGLHLLGHKPFRPWLFTIAHNVIVDIYRAHHDVSSLDVLRACEDPGDSPEAIAIDQERRGAMYTLLSQLPKRDREVVELRMAGLNGLEIAQTLNCSHEAVRTAHRRAKDRMRVLLSAMPDEDG